MHPFKALWSEYKSAEEMEADARFTCFLNNDTLPALVKYYQEHIMEEEVAALEVAKIKEIAQGARTFLTHPSTILEVEACNLKKEKLITHRYFKELKIKRKCKIIEGLKAFMAIKFPSKFLQVLAEENFLDIPMA